MNAAMNRYALGIEYDGSRYYGWQSQRQQPTVQDSLQTALSAVADEPVQVVCAGRTDTGVHALCQVVHFDTSAARSERSWVLGCNAHLEAAAAVLWARPVPASFHARFTAVSRTYRYRILNRWVRPAIARERQAWERHPLDERRMHEAAQCLLGEHDFSAFRASGCQASHAVREIKSISVQRNGDQLSLKVTANGFLYHMVRNLAGSLMLIGKGEQDDGWLRSVLESRDRTLAGITAPAEGLYFMHPDYPSEFALPKPPLKAFPRCWNGSI